MSRESYLISHVSDIQQCILSTQDSLCTNKYNVSSAGQYFNILGISRYFLDNIAYHGQFLISKYCIRIFIIFMHAKDGFNGSL